MAYSSDDYDEFYCDKCERSFVSEQALQAHLTHSSRHHFYCDKCERRFVSEQALQAHLTHSSRHHVYNGDDEFYCDNCQRSFVSEQALQAHLTYSSYHHYCADCERDFTSNNDLRHHLASKRHQAPFIFCPRCKAGFVSASALTKHIEMCRRCFNISNQQILHGVRQLEVRCGVPNFLTTPLTAGSAQDGDDDSCNELTVYATEASYNGSCYVCPICDRGFQRLMSLNQHLNSNTHEPSEFRCRKCCKIFIELSALIAHVESEACDALSALINYMSARVTGHVESAACGTILSAPVTKHVESEVCSAYMSAPVTGHVESAACGTILNAPVNGHNRSEVCSAYMSAPINGHVETEACGTMSAPVNGRDGSEVCSAISEACGTMSAPVNGHDGSGVCSTMISAPVNGHVESEAYRDALSAPVNGHAESEACDATSADRIRKIVRKFGSMSLIACRAILLGIWYLFLFLLFLSVLPPIIIVIGDVAAHLMQFGSMSRK
ncbi:hypothetical protein L7F22_022936 [Adiantum nelumboides]|nr:hypothetical protein [Adiantum nelumboides]